MATTEQAKAAVRPWRRIGPGAMVLLFVLTMLLLLAAAFVISSLASSWRLEAEIDKIRAADEPAAAADLDALYAYPPRNRDTTQLWLDAFAVLDSPQYQSDAQPLPYVGEGDTAPSPGEPWPQLDEAEAFLANYRDPLEKLHRATALGGEARFPIKLSGGVATLGPHFQQLRGAVRLLWLESEVRARRNDFHGAAESIRAIFAAARSLEPQPLVVCQLVRIAINRTAYEQLKRLLPLGRFSESDLIEFDRDLAAIDEEAIFRQELLGDRAMGIHEFENPPAAGPGAAAAHRLLVLRNIDEMKYLEVMEKYIAASRSSKLPLRGVMDQAQNEVSEMFNSPAAQRRYSVTRLALPSIQATIGAICQAQARQAAARGAIAIERFRRSQGQMPKTLAELVPEFLDQPLVDPFDGAPLRFKSDAAGYKVYSIGPDGIDQGGESGKGEQELDIVFEVSFEARASAGGSPSESERTEPTPGREK